MLSTSIKQTILIQNKKVIKNSEINIILKIIKIIGEVKTNKSIKKLSN